MCKNKVQLQKGLSLPDFMAKFGTEAQCEAALETAKWLNGFYALIVDTTHFRALREAAQNVNATSVNIKPRLSLALFFMTPNCR